MKVIKKVKCPVRIDFAGGTTDIEPFASREGGYVLNATINKYVKGELIYNSSHLSLHYECEVPTNAGLGTTGAMNLCWLALITDNTNKITLAENAYKIEQARGERGGRQDQYASAVGGINFMRFNKEGVHIENIDLSKELIKELNNRLVLVYSIKKRLSKTQNQEMMERYKKNDKTLIKLLRNIKEITYEMTSYLKKGDLDEFGRLFNEEWNNRKQLHPTKTNPELNEFIENGLKYATGAKVCGSAGGGCVLFYTKEKVNLIRKLKNFLIIDFNFDFDGLKIEKVER
jgi:D-glycero-alpha-D-manno-heptose-7-phosphate kinase